MSTDKYLPGNPHYAFLHAEPMDPASGLANAVLALVWEQRTANLLAYVGHDPATAIINDELDPVIRERLGLPVFENRQVP